MKLFWILVVCATCTVGTVCWAVPKQETMLQMIKRVLSGKILPEMHYVTLDGKECL